MRSEDQPSKPTAMADNKTTNIDFLCIIRENGGKAAFETVDIPASQELVQALEVMVEDDGATVLDMQVLMDGAFPETERGSYNYVSPYSYKSTYIEPARYPAKLSAEEYRQKMDSREDSLRKSFDETHDYLLEENPGKYRTELEKYVASRLVTYARDLKKGYLFGARRYVNATNYYRTLAEVRQAGDVRMWSTDTRGWSDFSYKVTDDVTITLGTNFGFGSAAYFKLNLRYKGINILPYSHLVRYYYANRRDLIRYTRLYDPTHESWNAAFAFVEQTANLAAQSAQEFVREWILNEVREMVSRLHVVLDKPGFYIQEMLSQGDGESDCGFLTVRNMDDCEKRRYGVYPEEMTMALQAEKITGALDFLGNLAELSSILPEIEASVAEIQDMAVAIIPSLDVMVKEIGAKVRDLTELKAVKEAQLSAVHQEMEPHEKAIDGLYESRGEERKWWSRGSFESEYAEAHAEYARMKEKAKQLDDEVYRLGSDIRMRSSFRDGLLECRQRVTDAGLLEARKAA